MPERLHSPETLRYVSSVASIVHSGEMWTNDFRFALIGRGDDEGCPVSFAAGRVEVGEHPLYAVRRETKEELGLVYPVERFTHRLDVSSPEFTFPPRIKTRQLYSLEVPKITLFGLSRQWSTCLADVHVPNQGGCLDVWYLEGEPVFKTPEVSKIYIFDQYGLMLLKNIMWRDNAVDLQRAYYKGEFLARVGKWYHNNWVKKQKESFFTS